MTKDEADATTSALLSSLDARVTGVRGALVASVDGRLITHHLAGAEPGSSAAIVASACALGRRLAELVGDGAMDEMVVRARGGYVVIYAISDRAVLTVLTRPSTNLARLHIEARDLVPKMALALAGRDDD